MVRSGFGVHICSDSTLYMGNWDNDKMNGSGRIQFSSGASYEGEFLNNCFNGKGQYTWPNGSSFHGIFYNNRFLVLFLVLYQMLIDRFHGKVKALCVSNQQTWLFVATISEIVLKIMQSASMSCF